MNRASPAARRDAAPPPGTSHRRVGSQRRAPPGRHPLRARPRNLYRWHRRAGVAAAAFLVYLLATGLPLQYSGALQLGSQHIGWAPVLDWYGFEAPSPARTSAGVTGVGDLLFADGRLVGELPGFRGALAVDGLLLAAGEQQVLLLEPGTWEVIDRFDLEGVQQIGRQGARLLLETRDGLLEADDDLLSWQPAEAGGASIDWARAAPDRSPRAETYRTAFRARMLSAERLLQDLHSGRLFGLPGIIVVDAASALLLFLAVSGLLMWWRTYRR